MRRRYRWNPATQRQELISESSGSAGITIIPDLEPFVSPVDGKVITGRKALRDHNKRHNVANVDDFKETWAKAAEQRARFYGGDAKYDQRRRVEHLINAIEKHSRRRP